MFMVPSPTPTPLLAFFLVGLVLSADYCLRFAWCIYFFLIILYKQFGVQIVWELGNKLMTK